MESSKQPGANSGLRGGGAISKLVSYKCGENSKQKILQGMELEPEAINRAFTARRALYYNCKFFQVEKKRKWRLEGYLISSFHGRRSDAHIGLGIVTTNKHITK